MPVSAAAVEAVAAAVRLRDARIHGREVVRWLRGAGSAAERRPRADLRRWWRGGGAAAGLFFFFFFLYFL